MTEILASFQELLVDWGVPAAAALIATRLTVIALVVLISFLANLLTKQVLLRVLKSVFERTANKVDDVLLESGVMQRLAHIVPACVISLCAPLMFPEEEALRLFVERLAFAYMIIIVLLGIDALLNAGQELYRRSKYAVDRPIKAYVQVVKLVVYIVGLILVVAMLLDVSPWGLLSGLGAMTAVLMLVFRDSILGLVASIQIVANNMVREGDWIEMPKFGADGDVIDVSLTTVKIQNWDKTISTIPTYSLVAESFKNWRGMSESGGRRIKRSISIDMQTVKFCTEEMLSRFKKIALLADFIKGKEAEIAQYNAENQVDESVPVNGRRMTNIGVFRAYIEAYLREHPKIHNDMTFLVRQLAPNEKGMPIELYVFSNDQVWANYEALQADIFDHIMAVIPQFDLRVFQHPSGYDLRATMN